MQTQTIDILHNNECTFVRMHRDGMSPCNLYAHNEIIYYMHCTNIASFQIAYSTAQHSTYINSNISISCRKFRSKRHMHLYRIYECHSIDLQLKLFGPENRALNAIFNCYVHVKFMLKFYCDCRFCFKILIVFSRRVLILVTAVPHCIPINNGAAVMWNKIKFLQFI